MNKYGAHLTAALPALGIAALTGWLSILMPMPSQARPGDLDTTFGTGGKALVHFTPWVGESCHGVAIQSSGKILLAGESNYGDAVARFNPNGTLDTTFGSGGKLYQYTHGFPQTLLLVAEDQFILAGGSFLDDITKEYFYMRRYTRDGSPDLTFGNAGAVATDMGYWAFVLDAAVQPDGKIVLVGPTQTGANQDFGVARYHPNGSLDTSFGSGGIVKTDLGKQRDRCSGVAIQPDGKVLVAGYSENGSDDARFAVVRYTTNGLLDATFNGTGKVTTYFGSCSEAFAIAVQNDGKILLAGWVNLQMALARYNPDGSLDTSFGTAGNGLVTLKVNSWDSWQRVALQPGGKILVAGHTSTTGQLVVGRYTPDGRLDAGFGNGGVVVTTLGSQSSEASDLALQPDGKLLVAGSAWNTSNSYSDMGVLRLENDVVIPPTVTCPSPALVDCDQPAELNALVHNPSGLALTVVWSVNGQPLQTNALAATSTTGPVPVFLHTQFPLGTNSLTVSVSDTFNHTDACSTLVVGQDRTPPTILSAEVTPNLLWPPNHQMVPVQIEAQVADNSGCADWKIVRVSSNEPANGTADGNAEPDWLITDAHNVQLRAERSGSGMGRVYLIRIQAYDASGNLSEPKTLTVTVPKAERKLRGHAVPLWQAPLPGKSSPLKRTGGSH